MDTWVGEFRSDTFKSIHGRLRTQLRPLNQFNYKTEVVVCFDGFAAIISGIFNKVMRPSITVCEGSKFVTKIGPSDVEFFIDTPLSCQVTEVKGHYISSIPSMNYRSCGKFVLRKK